MCFHPVPVALVSALLCFSVLQCKQRDDPRIEQLQKDVIRLQEENTRLQSQVQDLRHELTLKETLPAAPPQTTEARALPEMTVDQMKVDLQPLLKDVIQKIKDSSESEGRGDQFHMRVEYDLKRAIYGLVRNEDPLMPYWGKVIVRYEKFLESDSYSRSYGSGSVQLLFAYTNNRWVLINYR